MLHTTSSFYSLNPNIHHTIEDHEGFSIFLRVPWHFFILLFSNFLFFFLSVAVFNYLWEWLVVGTYPVYVRKTRLLEVRGEKQEVRDYHLWLTDFITRSVVEGTFISRIWESENYFFNMNYQGWPWIKHALWDAKASELSLSTLFYQKKDELSFKS